MISQIPQRKINFNCTSERSRTWILIPSRNTSGGNFAFIHSLITYTYIYNDNSRQSFNPNWKSHYIYTRRSSPYTIIPISRNWTERRTAARFAPKVWRQASRRAGEWNYILRRNVHVIYKGFLNCFKVCQWSIALPLSKNTILKCEMQMICLSLARLLIASPETAHMHVRVCTEFKVSNYLSVATVYQREKKKSRYRCEWLPSFCNSFSRSDHSSLKRLAPVSEPSPPMTQRLYIPRVTKFLAAFFLPSRSLKSWLRAEPITVPPCNNDVEFFLLLLIFFLFCHVDDWDDTRILFEGACTCFSWKHFKINLANTLLLREFFPRSMISVCCFDKWVSYQMPIILFVSRESTYPMNDARYRGPIGFDNVVTTIDHPLIAFPDKEDFATKVDAHTNHSSYSSIHTCK